MIVLIDNYDSFSYNVYQLIGSVEPDIKVIRNDEYTVEEIEVMKPEALILSPGPGKPADAGVCIEAIRYFAGKLPIFGICLGHQAICEAFGGRVSYAKELMHGKKKTIYTVGKNKIFEGLGDQIIQRDLFAPLALDLYQMFQHGSFSNLPWAGKPAPHWYSAQSLWQKRMRQAPHNGDNIRCDTDGAEVQ